METKNVNITLEKAREWFKKGGDLKEVALQAFTEDELTIPEWRNIKTFEDACKALGIDSSSYIVAPYTAGREIASHLHALYRLDIIRKALNGNWKPSLVQGTVYYPYVRFYSAGKEAAEAAYNNDWSIGKSFNADGRRYTLVGGNSSYYNYGGLTSFSYEYGDTIPCLGLLGCKSREIAEHMSRYFMKEIFEAIYANHVGTYEWV